MAVVHRLELGHVVLPDSHPRSADKTCPIVCFAVSTNDGVIVVDTGPRVGHPIIDEMYAPTVCTILEALHDAELDERDVLGIVNTHLHFDHCGQNHLLSAAPIWATDEEVGAASLEFYTVPDWAKISDTRRRRTADGESIAAGVRLLHTPGHTPGHQSVVAETKNGVELIAGQVCYSCSEFSSGPPATTDMHDESWVGVGIASLERLRALAPDVVHLSHDLTVLRS